MIGPAHSLLMLRARRGEFSSAAELALVASVTRMTAYRWLMAARIDIAAARLDYLAKAQVQHQRAAVDGGKAPMTAREQRRLTVLSVKRLNDAQARRKGAKQGPQSGRAVALEAQAEDGKPD